MPLDVTDAGVGLYPAAPAWSPPPPPPLQLGVPSMLGGFSLSSTASGAEAIDSGWTSQAFTPVYTPQPMLDAIGFKGPAIVTTGAGDSLETIVNPDIGIYLRDNGLTLGRRYDGEQPDTFTDQVFKGGTAVDGATATYSNTQDDAFEAAIYLAAAVIGGAVSGVGAGAGGAEAVSGMDLAADAAIGAGNNITTAGAVFGSGAGGVVGGVSGMDLAADAAAGTANNVTTAGSVFTDAGVGAGSWLPSSPAAAAPAASSAIPSLGSVANTIGTVAGTIGKVLPILGPLLGGGSSQPVLSNGLTPQQQQQMQASQSRGLLMVAALAAGAFFLLRK